MQNGISNLKSLFFQNFFNTILIVLGLISLVLLQTRHQAEFGAVILEATFMLYTFLGFWWAKKNDSKVNIIIVRWLSLAYVAFSYIYAVEYNKANLMDFLMIYKSFFYLYFLTFLTGKHFMTFFATNRFFFIMVALFTLKYLAAILITNAPRPILYLENNFELMFVYALYLIRYTVNKEKFLLLLGLVGVITILSLSRSSLLMYSILVLFVFYDSFKKTRVFIIPGTILILGTVVFLIFTQRSSSVEDIDRYRFLLVWWSQVKDWDLFQWLVGAPRITPLSYSACRTMSYFQNLFSYSGDGSCYSVVLHSFLMRVIYDHGLLGLGFIIYATYQMLVQSGVRKDVTWVFIAIVLINGLSVSSFNNLFFAISMVFLMATNTVMPMLDTAISEEDDDQK